MTAEKSDYQKVAKTTQRSRETIPDVKSPISN